MVFKVIQISGSASLYYVVKTELHGAINVKLKRKILSTLLNGMFAHKQVGVVSLVNTCGFKSKVEKLTLFSNRKISPDSKIK